MVAFLVFITTYKTKWLFAFLSTLFCLLGVNFSTNAAALTQRKIIFYNTPNHLVIDIVNGKESIFITDESFLGEGDKFFSSHEKFKQTIRVTQQKKYAVNKTVCEDYCFLKNNYACFFDRKIVVINENYTIDNIKDRGLEVDYVILSHNPFVDVEKLRKKVIFKKIIIASSNSHKNNMRWKALFVKHNIDYYSIIDSGAYLEDV